MRCIRPFPYSFIIPSPSKQENVTETTFITKVSLTQNRLNCLNRNYTKPVGMKWKCLKTLIKHIKHFKLNFLLIQYLFSDKNN